MRDYAAEVRTMPTSRLLILLAFKGERDAWAEGVSADAFAMRRFDATPHQIRVESINAILAEIDRRFPVPA